jgi:hypothetical protein
MKLFKNREVRARLAALLGRPHRLGDVAKADLPGVGAGVELDVQHKVVEPEATLAIALRPEGGTPGLDGDLWFERAETPLGAEPVFHRVGRPIAVRYNGPTADSLQLRVDAPEQVGAYRLAFYNRDQAEPIASDDLFVQEPQAGPSV